MNIFIAEKVIAAVQELLNGNIKHKRWGICGNLRMLLPNYIVAAYLEEACLDACFRAWLKYSGNIAFPIPDPAGGSVQDIYEGTDDKWKEGSAYTALRIELCHFIIDYLKRYYRL